MILYLDTSALVKRYVAERGSTEVAVIIDQASIVGTCLVTRVEMSAALAKAVRMSALTLAAASAALQVFRSEWPQFVRVQIGEALVTRADTLAWEFGLRGYDAVHLAAALQWQDAMGESVTFATYDIKLWQVALVSGLTPSPADLPTLLAA
jgi:predicted nucleic acid-binding protein